MPLFPLFAVLIVTGLTEGFYFVSLVASVFYLVTRRGQGLYAKAGVIGLICIASFHTPLQNRYRQTRLPSQSKVEKRMGNR